MKTYMRMVAMVALVVMLLPGMASAKGFDILGILTQALADNQQKFPLSEDRPIPMLRSIRVVATAYSSEPRQTDDTPCNGAMWSYDLCEHYVKYGTEDTIAANFLFLGTKVRFPELYGDKVFTVRDRMNARYNFDVLGYYRIDFYKAALDENGDMDNVAARQKALDFGVRQRLKMDILAA